MQNLVARRERKEVLEEVEEEESRERETLKCNLLYILKTYFVHILTMYSVYILTMSNFQTSDFLLSLHKTLSFGYICPIFPFLFVQRGEIYLTTLRSAPEGRNIRKI